MNGSTLPLHSGWRLRPSKRGTDSGGDLGAMVAGGQLSPAVGAVLTNVISGTASLAAAAAPYVAKGGGYTALGLFDYALGQALYNEVAAIEKGQCKP